MGIMGKVRGKEKKEIEMNPYVVLQDIIEGHNAKIIPGDSLEDPNLRYFDGRDQDISVWDERREAEQNVPPFQSKGRSPDERLTIVLENVTPEEVVELEEKLVAKINKCYKEANKRYIEEHPHDPAGKEFYFVTVREATYSGDTLKIVFNVYANVDGEAPKTDEPLRECAPGTVNPWEQADQSR